MLKMLLRFATEPNHLFSADDIYDAMKQKKDELDSLHSEIQSQEKGKKINATPEQLDKIKEGLKDSMRNAPKVKLSE